MRTRHNATRNIFSSREPLTARANVPAREREKESVNQLSKQLDRVAKRAGSARR